ncbi:hypothetical protein A6A06_13180 [Streptomyces sp. CB02923]|uniref:DUF3224 domain-containing protein n=1 Tax=Streptomyces sp. CB02923 TaxID=1718985 RepID=UPI00093DE6DB|nr:DUF3224 domain-containing protein [Streptomyces sp. CB02923]OKI02049.1 hypothetical protein A6A06_13180 [Streptomyces sp. CB02923]
MPAQTTTGRTRTTGHFTYADWKEHALNSDGGFPRLAHAAVTNAFSGGIEAAHTVCEYTIVYVTEKTGTFTGMELLEGGIDGRRGTFAVEERGSFGDRGSVHCTFEVVPGSATGDLAGLRGTGEFTAEHGSPSVPYTFDYDFG